MEQRTASDGHWEIYEPQKRQFEPVVEMPPQSHVIIDTSRLLNELVKEVEARLPIAE